jgi:hypothetical protein
MKVVTAAALDVRQAVAERALRLSQGRGDIRERTIDGRRPPPVAGEPFSDKARSMVLSPSRAQNAASSARLLSRNTLTKTFDAQASPRSKSGVSCISGWRSHAGGHNLTLGIRADWPESTLSGPPSRARCAKASMPAEVEFATKSSTRGPTLREAA